MRLASKMAAIAAASLLAFGCGHKKPEGGGGEGTAAQKSLYERLGGKDAINVVVDDFVTNVAGDARINKFFTAAAGDPEEMKHFKEMLVDQICQATGGPCEYKGKSMPEAHKGMAITHEDFTALVEDLKKSLDSHSVPAQEQSELLGALGPLEPDIVGK